jgi:hypothetical protein
VQIVLRPTCVGTSIYLIHLKLSDTGQKTTSQTFYPKTNHTTQ